MSHRAFRKDEVSKTEAKLRRRFSLLLVRESRQRLTTSRWVLHNYILISNFYCTMNVLGDQCLIIEIKVCKTKLHTCAVFCLSVCLCVWWMHTTDLGSAGFDTGLATLILQPRFNMTVALARTVKGADIIV